MDIGQLTTSETAECVIKNPVTGDDTDIVIILYGQDSKKFRELVKAQAKIAAELKGKGKELEDSIERDADYLAELTAGWRNVEFDGKHLEFSKANAVLVYTMSAPIRNQVNLFIARTVNFLPKA